MPRIMSLLISDSLSISCMRGLTLSFANLATNKTYKIGVAQQKAGDSTSVLHHLFLL